MSRKLAAALALLIAVALLPIPALANPITMLDFTAMESVDNTDTDHWKWDKDSKTLTLNGVDLAAQLRLPPDATIEVNGNNSISVSHQNGPSQSSNHFVVGNDGIVTITGPGTLNITSGTGQDLSVDNGTRKGLWVGDLVLGMEGQRGPTVTLTNYMKGVAVIKGDIEVNSGSLNIRSTAANSGGILGNALVKGGSLDIEAMSGGIHGHLTVTGGNVRIKALNQGSGDGEEGIALEGLLNVEGGVVWLTSHAPGGINAHRFAPAILQEELSTDLTVRGSTNYNDSTPTQPVTWKPRGPAVATDPGNPNNPTPGGRSNRAPARSPGGLLYPFIGDTPAKTVKISAGDDSGSQSGIIIYVPTDDTPNTTTGNPTTGANDFVSTATAAALMALLGAAALLRK